MSLVDLALAAILHLARPPHADPILERPRLEELARAVAEAVEEREALAGWLPGAALPLPVSGRGARERSALLLVAIAHHESGFAADVSDCRKLGALGDATAFQLLGRFAHGPYSRAELCSSPRRAAERALFVLAHHAARCRSVAKALAGYASGDCGRPSRASRETLATWRRILAHEAK